jgi:hypothetical protein
MPGGLLHRPISILPPIPISRFRPALPLIGAIFGIIGVIVGAFALHFAGRLPTGVERALGLSAHGLDGMQRAGSPIPPPLDTTLTTREPEPPSTQPAKVKKGRGPIAGGVLFVPENFTAGEGGGFDLVIHFHGNTDLTIESYESLGFNAVIVVVNVGVGSGPYEERFASPAAMQALMQRIPIEMQERGLKGAHVSRLALSSWSAGYGAVMKVLEQPAYANRVDSVILLDGLHVGYKEGSLVPEDAMLRSIERFAERAKAGERLLVVTHSNIEPIGYLGVKETADILLKKLGMERKEVSGQTTIPDLPSGKGILPKDEIVALVPKSEARAGGVVVRGYRGNQPNHHISHLLQMSQTALPLLAERWRAAPADGSR